MARVVIRMGRSRTRAARISASLRDRPARRCTLVKSTNKMAFLMTTPTSDRGSDSMTASG